MTKSAKLSPADLRQFAGGTVDYHRHGLNRNVVFTDGAKYVADQGGAYWLLDSIALAQLCDRRVAAEEFQVWRLAVRHDRSAVLTCEDGNYRVVFQYRISYSDFPAPGVSLWFSNGVIYLPVEH
jgi:hypothetical protein